MWAVWMLGLVIYADNLTGKQGRHGSKASVQFMICSADGVIGSLGLPAIMQ